MIRLFEPILAGASLRDRLVTAFGAGLGVAVTAAASLALARIEPGLPLIIAPIGASAVLVFVIPASPMAQPWPVIGGNTISLLVGLAAVAVAGPGALAAGLAVGSAIVVMSLLRCLHPSSGAVALSAVIAANMHHPVTPAFALAPVAFDSAILVAAGLVFHRFSGHSYPHRPGAARVLPPVAAFERQDVEAALADLGETFDIEQADLELLLAQTEQRAQARRLGRS